MTVDRAADRDNAEKLEMLARLRPIDDVFMCQMFRDNVPLTELLLRRVIGIDSLTVERVDVQFDVDLRAVGARSLRLDVLATDADGGLYNVEVQRRDSGASPQRARYHVGAIDVNSTGADADFKKMPQVFVIFITENDIFHRGRGAYRFERLDTATGEPLGDGTHIIYVNVQCRGDDPLGDLMHDFRCSNPDDMRVPLMGERAAYLKTCEEGVKFMCQLMEEYGQKIKARRERDIAMNMLNAGIDSAIVAQCTGIPLSQVNEISRVGLD